MDTSLIQPRERWQVKLQIFEGPLDLLLHLVRKEEVDIRDIPIATIAEQYLAYLELMKELNLNVAGEFLLMAATLVYLKSRSLIPRELLEEVTGEEGEDEDPEETFYRELDEYRRFREAALQLAEKRLHQETLWPRGVPQDDLSDDGEPYLEASLFDLIEAFRQVQARWEEAEAAMRIRRRRATVREKAFEIVSRLRGEKSIEFTLLFEPDGDRPVTRSDLVSTFLAILELMRLRVIRVLQRVRFGKLRVVKSVTDEEMESRCHERFREESAG